MGDSGIPEHLLREAELAIAPGSIPAREARAWLADWQGIRGVLRCRPVPGSAAARARLLDDVAWLHAFLARLAGAGFPSPQPLAAFGGRSWTTADGLVWELVSYLPGREVGWDSQPPIGQIGILLARYHAAAGRVPVARQRPSVMPLADVPAILLSGRLAAVCRDTEPAAVIRRLAARLTADLDDLGHPAAGRLVIHGDFTSHNAIADGTPRRTVGVIDFQRAHLEVPLAVFLYGRGLQMIAKRAQAGQAGTGILPQVQWIAGNATAISDAIADALP